MEKYRIVDFLIVLTVAAIFSTGTAIYILYRASEAESFAMQVSQSNSTIENFRWIIESEIEENTFHSSQNRPDALEHWQTAVSTSLVALRFIEIENEEQGGIWETFYKQARQKLTNAERVTRDLKAARAFAEDTERFLLAYRDRSAMFISQELEDAETSKAIITRLVLIIFLLHIFLFIISVRFDLQALHREFRQ